jgi:GNAT superfamily N-acetyltransferase
MMRIRSATLADAADIAHVHVESWRATYPGLVPDAVLANLSEDHRALQWINTLGNRMSPEFVYVAEDDAHEVVGFASGGPTRSEDPDYAGELYAIYLLPPAQKQGVGKQLAQAVARHLAEQGKTSMIVWVITGNPAAQFYEALGGHFVREASFTMGGTELQEAAYGWADTSALVGAP